MLHHWSAYETASITARTPQEAEPGSTAAYEIEAFFLTYNNFIANATFRQQGGGSMKTSLKELAARRTATAEQREQAAPPANDRPAAPIKHIPEQRNYRTAQTRNDTRQVSGHFKPDASQTLRLIAVEQDRDVQEILAEALNMVFQRYGKATRAEVTSGRRKKPTT